MRVLLAVMLFGASAGGCAHQDTAYHFRAPLVSSVYAAELPPPHVAPGQRADTAHARIRHRKVLAPHGRDQAAAPEAKGRSRAAERTEDSAGARDGQSGSMADVLRSLVGQREPKATHVEFAFAALEAVGVRLAEEARSATTGPELLAVAEAREALDKKAPLPGDLVVFDRVEEDQEASLVGVIVAVHAYGEHATAEFVYLSRGVVRRGYVTPEAPAVKRDAEGRALNTFVRHLDGKTPANAAFLAGELFRTYVRIERLSAPTTGA